MRNINKLDVTFAILALVVGIAFWVLVPFQVDQQRAAYGITSRFFPVLTAILLIVASGILLLQNLLRRTGQPTEKSPGFKWSEIRTLAPFLIIVVVYVSLLDIVGYLSSTFAALMVLLVWSGSRNMLLNLIITAVIPLVLYLFFQKVMEVPLPEGVLF